MKIVALEEHFATAEVMQGWKSVDSRWSDLALKPSTEGEGARQLLDLGAERLDAMNEAGIDIAVLSLTTPGVQNLDAEVAVDLARSCNDHLAAAVHTTPERFQGFATLPTPSPDRAAKELVRCIRELDLHGAMLHGRISSLSPAPGAQSSHWSHRSSTVSTDLADLASRSSLRGARTGSHQTLQATAHVEDDSAASKSR